MTQSEPATAAGACASRITRQSARASGAIRELSWDGSGVATRPSGPSAKVARKADPLGPQFYVATAGKAPDQGHQKQEGADVRRDGISRNAQDLHRAQPAVHHRTARTQRDAPEREVETLGSERALHEVML